MFKYVTVDGDDAEGDTLRMVRAEDLADDIQTSYYDGEPPLYSKVWTMVAGELVRVELVQISARTAEPGERWGKDTWRAERWQIKHGDTERETFTVWVNTKHEKA
jgi:hypothetical protein